MEQQVISRAEDFVREFFARDASGHDAWHTFRVRSLALRLAKMEGADPLTVELAALLHDVDDRKLSPETHESLGNAVGFLRRENVEEERIDRLKDFVANFKDFTEMFKQMIDHQKALNDAQASDTKGKRKRGKHALLDESKRLLFHEYVFAFDIHNFLLLSRREIFNGFCACHRTS